MPRTLLVEECRARRLEAADCANAGQQEGFGGQNGPSAAASVSNCHVMHPQGSMLKDQDPHQEMQGCQNRTIDSQTYCPGSRSMAMDAGFQINLLNLTFQDPDPWPWMLDSKSCVLSRTPELHVFRASSSLPVQDFLLGVEGMIKIMLFYSFIIVKIHPYICPGDLPWLTLDVDIYLSRGYVR